jgi:hypothetical protein
MDHDDQQTQKDQCDQDVQTDGTIREITTITNEKGDDIDRNYKNQRANDDQQYHEVQSNGDDQRDHNNQGDLNDHK